VRCEATQFAMASTSHVALSSDETRSIGPRAMVVVTHTLMQKIKAKDQSVRKIEWKQTDGQTDGGESITSSRANAVGSDVS